MSKLPGDRDSVRVYRDDASQPVWPVTLRFVSHRVEALSDIPAWIKPNHEALFARVAERILMQEHAEASNVLLYLHHDPCEAGISRRIGNARGHAPFAPLALNHHEIENGRNTG